MPNLTQPPLPPLPPPAYRRDTVKIPSRTPGWNIDAWCYLPTGSVSYGKKTVPRRPVIVLAHGLSGNKTMGLDAYGATFACAGYAAVAFDYRRWGASDGTPRHAVVVKDQLEDYRTVVEWCRAQPEIDTTRIIVWGTSFAGGHALTLASESNLKLAGAIAQCPYTGVFPRFTLGLLLAIFLALWDLFRRALGGAPVYIRAAAPPGHAGAMTVQGSVEGMGALCGEWCNQITAASLFQIPLYDPGAHAHEIAQPTLIVPGLRDQIFVWKPRSNVATRAPPGRVSVAEVDGDHWCVYPGQSQYRRSIEAQLAFLRTHIPV